MKRAEAGQEVVHYAHEQAKVARAGIRAAQQQAVLKSSVELIFVFNLFGGWSGTLARIFNERCGWGKGLVGHSGYSDDGEDAARGKEAEQILCFMGKKSRLPLPSESGIC